MELIRSFPMSVSSGEEILDRRRSWTAWVRMVMAWLGLTFSAGLICFLVALWPAATVLALGAGTIVLWIGRRLRWRAVLHGDAGRGLASFHLVNGILECTFHKDAVNRYERSLQWRAAAAIAAGTVCLAAQYLHWLAWNLSALMRILPWLARTGSFCSPLLPLTLGVLFFFVRGPATRWQEAWKAAIRARATEAVAEIMRAGELDGLEAGIAGLYRQLDLWWAGDYRADLRRWIESHTAEAIFEPDAAAAFLSNILELARTHLNCLAEAAESFRSVECRQFALEALMRATGEAHPEIAEKAARSMDELRNHAIAQRWERFRERAAEVAGELDDSILEFRLRSRSAVTLPAGADPYRILGTEASAPTAAIKKLRLRLAQVYHPDIGGDTGNDSKMAELNAAYDAVMRKRAAPGT
jgi:DnaJ-domain-containing protein 1